MDQFQVIILTKSYGEPVQWCRENLVNGTWHFEVGPWTLVDGPPTGLLSFFHHSSHITIPVSGPANNSFQFSFSNPDDAMRFKLIFG